ncbi:MAG: pyruvate dehydrogenase complex dihydrolipoamide acetyltransferase [Micropepsaceae bacterium]
MATNILMPALSPTMEEGTLAKWHVKEGDEVKAGDILAEIETDKATMEFEAIDDGRIGKILVEEGAEGVKVNEPIAVLLEEGESADAVPAAAPAAGAAPPAKPEEISSAMSEIGKAVSSETRTPTPAPAPAPQAANPAESSNGARIFASPLAKRIAEQKGIDLKTLQGSGPRGRIVKADVEAAKPGAIRTISIAPPAGAATPQTAPGIGVAALPDARLFYQEDSYEETVHDSMRKTIAKRLTSAKTLIPHYYLTIECDIDALLEARARLNARSPKGDGAYKLSVNDFIIKASAMALMKHPDVNASWTDTAILRHKHADIGIAVALDFGLITPIVFAADGKGLAEISELVKSLAEKARNKKLKPQEFEGGSFSISNLGMFGIKEFTAVINPPQGAIMAVGAGQPRAVVREGEIVSATIMSVTMSCDHRVIDGATGARFLQTFKDFVEEPASMLL